MSISNIDIKDVKTGMKIGCDTHINDKLILKRHTVISDKIIALLKYNGFTFVAIENEKDNEDIRECNKNRMKAWVKREQLNGLFGDTFKVDIDVLMNRGQGIIKTYNDTYKILDMLKYIREYDETTYIHSINVGLVASIIAEWSNLSKEEIDIATLGGLMHDIGKVKVPVEIITKKVSLTDDEFRIIMKHPEYGYNMIIDTPIDERVKLAILQHHEKCDGSGYPYGIAGKNIDTIAKITTIADIYDAMTSKRSYREPICSFEVMQEFERGGLQKYEARFLFPFFRGISQNYINKSVRLSTGDIGKVVGINTYDISRPVVNINSNLVDLSRNKNVYIEGIIDSGG